MEKPGITIDIPGFGERHIRIAVSDYTGTHSFGGVIEPDVKRKLRELAAVVDLHIVTADSFGTAERELAGIAIPYKLRSGRHDIEKVDYVSHFHLPHVAAFGNGNNDRLMLRAVKEGGGLAIAVDNGEGCALDAMRNADLFVVGAANAMDLLLDPLRLKATPRFCPTKLRAAPTSSEIFPWCTAPPSLIHLARRARGRSKGDRKSTRLNSSHLGISYA